MLQEHDWCSVVWGTSRTWCWGVQGSLLRALWGSLKNIITTQPERHRGHGGSCSHGSMLATGAIFLSGTEHRANITRVHFALHSWAALGVTEQCCDSEESAFVPRGPLRKLLPVPWLVGAGISAGRWQCCPAGMSQTFFFFFLNLWTLAVHFLILKPYN